ncbi:polyphenol oxidase family protein [Proteinivorax tanatarense]|uniref:Polyphenol oxidase family protein n=1 Tax=Proteinivorax tanatarense TaxID=1260629 RepID=A0AAU7VL10_9FIRM
MSIYKFSENSLDIFVSTTDLGSFKIDTASKIPPRQSFNNLNNQTKVPLDKIVRPNLANGSDYVEVSLKDGGRGVVASKDTIDNKDGLITKDKGLYLSITTADCYPIVLHDPKQSILALAHGGWRGVVGKLEIKLLKHMVSIGAKLEDISVIYVAGICKECYVQHDQYLYDVFINKYNYPASIVGKKDNLYSIDIAAASQHNFRQVGFNGNFKNLCLCNFCNPKLFSVRRDGKNTGRILTLVGMN